MLCQHVRANLGEADKNGAISWKTMNVFPETAAPDRPTRTLDRDAVATSRVMEHHPVAAETFPDDLPENLQGLARLGRDGDLDMRQVLLRVLTDLYVGQPHHTQNEIRQFEAVALGLLARTDADTRLIVARKLAACPATPAPLAERFVADGGAPAAAILSRSTVLPRAWLVCAALGEDTELASAVASRPDLDSDLCQILVTRPEIEVARALTHNVMAPLDPAGFRALVARAGGDRELGATLCARAPKGADLAPLFLHANHTQRGAILLSARRADLGERPRSQISATEAATAAEIETAALAHDMTLVAAIIARAFGSTLGVARELLDDPRGEPVALALGALHVEPDRAARIFMCLDPAIAHNVERVRALTDIVATIAPATAERLVRAMIDRDAPARRPPVRTLATDGKAAGAPSRPLDNARSAPLRKPGGLLFVRHKG